VAADPGQRSNRLRRGIRIVAALGELDQRSHGSCASDLTKDASGDEPPIGHAVLERADQLGLVVDTLLLR